MGRAVARTVNPYQSAAGELLERLRWDIQPQSWVSRKRLHAWRNRCAGSRCVVLCNGPSLNRVDFERLRGLFVFGLNKINLLFERTSFRPSCIVAINRLVLEQNAEFYRETPLPLFLDCAARKLVPPRPSVIYLHSTTTRGRPFARDCSVSVPQGGTVTYVALQLAFHMGFSDVALVGCDHAYAETGAANAVAVRSGRDLSHFDPTYFASGSAWQLPDLQQSELSYRTAREVFEAAGRRIVNATDGGLLEVFPRMGLDEFLGD